MILFSLFLSVLAYVLVMLGMGRLGKDVFRNTRDQLFFQIVRNFLCIVLMAVIGRRFLPHGFTLLMAGAMGAATLLSSVSSLACCRYGPVSISILIFSSFSMLISSLSGPVFWKESISILQIAGMVLSVLSMALLTEKSLVQKTSPKWFVFLFLAGIGGGMQGPVQKALTTSAYAGENTEFILYSFIFSTIASIITYFLAGKGNKKEQITYKVKGTVLLLFISQALLSVFLNINNLKLVEELPTIIFFPAYTIGGLLITTIASRFLFKEKMTLRQTVGFISGLFALLLVSGTLDKIPAL